MLAGRLRLEVLPLSQNAPIYLSPGVEPEYQEGTALQLIDVSLHRRVSVSLPAGAEPIVDHSGIRSGFSAVPSSGVGAAVLSTLK